ncbi:Outer membrane protein assembly factor BamD [Planctomycetes bacterium Pan216]|uniref:Outer membrane protein assembly factor BamD n=1 Tax=Kolteria novifilia TaxID=2527975 RepID=A0A518BB04_9BACT|nr:Outer membrane protein assembly factor BamD [Planctomycetes bacterium Pan216]
MKRGAMLTLGLLVLAGSIQAADEVEYRTPDGKYKVARGDITAETSKDVTIKNEKIPIYLIESVKYDQQSPQIVTADSLFKQGRYDDAIESYKEIGKASGDNPKLQARLLNSVFESMAEKAIAEPTGNYEEAIKWFGRLNDAYPESRHYYPAQELIGRVHLANGKYQEAAKAFGTLKDVDWPGYQEKATLYQGIAQVKQGNNTAAISDLDRVIKSPGTDPSIEPLRGAAEIYKGVALFNSGQVDESEKLIRAALKKIPADSYEIKAVGRNALGDILVKKQMPKEAMLEGYMWVVVVYNRTPEEVAKALYNLTQIMPGLGYEDRGKMMQAELQGTYPNSSWTKKLTSGS